MLSPSLPTLHFSASDAKEMDKERGWGEFSAKIYFFPPTPVSASAGGLY